MCKHLSLVALLFLTCVHLTRCHGINSWFRCAKGFYPDIWLDCGDCDPGYYCPGGYFHLKCPKGTFAAVRGSVKCTACSSGTYAAVPGSVYCKTCPLRTECRRADERPKECTPGACVCWNLVESRFCSHESCPTRECPSEYFQRTIKPNTTSYMDRFVISMTSNFAHEAYQVTEELVETEDVRYFITDEARGFVRILQDDTIIVSFRGTNDLWNVFSDIDIQQVKYDRCDWQDGCFVHKGFFESYDEVREGIMSNVREFRTRNSDAEIFVTGHSLGAAQATLAAVDISNLGFTTSLVTFGSPRVGNDVFSKYVNKVIKGRNIRVTHHNDPVTMIPIPFTGWGYKHVGKEIHYESRKASFELPQGVDVNQHLVHAMIDFKDHSMYNYISAVECCK